MRATTAFAALLLLGSASVYSQQLQPPAPPVVSVSANLKELIFDWERVPNAYTYWLMEKKDASSPYTRIGVRIPGGRPRAAVPLAVHLQNWPQARYRVSACNTAGCTLSAAIDPRDVMLDTIGYFKASNPGAGDLFGGVVMSSDGSTLAVGALFEASNATGINGNQADNSSPRSGAVYVYRRDGRRWRQEAYLKAGVNQADQYFGGINAVAEAVALSGDGSWLAVGAAMEDVQGVANAGTVYVYHRASDGTWRQQTTLNAPQLVNDTRFGLNVHMTDDGQTIKVSTHTPGDDDVNTDDNSQVYFIDRQGLVWQHRETFSASYPGYSCGDGRLSRDGKTLLVHCGSETQSPGDLVLTYKRSGNAWIKVSDLFMEPTAAYQQLQINYDATRLTLIEALPNSLERQLVILSWSGNQWVREAALQPPGAPNARVDWGWVTDVEFNRSGTMMAVSAYVAPLAGAGVMPTPVVGTVPHGAVFVFDRTSNSQERWKLRSVVKAPNPDRDDGFGISLALSANGWFMAVGAWREDSNASGIDGDRTNNASEDAGAVYLY